VIVKFGKERVVGQFDKEASQTRGSPRSFAAQRRLLRMTTKLTHYQRTAHAELVAEVTHACEEHGKSQTIGGCDYLGIAL
jgi:hypothetical protein